MSKRVLIGGFPDGGYGLRVSQSGYDVTSNPVDNSKLVFNSDWADVLGIYQTGTLSVSAGGTTTAAHNLGYIPFASALINIGGRGWEQLQCMNIAFPIIRSMSWSYTDYNTTNGSYYVTSTSRDFRPNPMQTYTFEGDGRTDAVQFEVTSTGVSFYSSAAAQLYYIIYCSKAF